MSHSGTQSSSNKTPAAHNICQMAGQLVGKHGLSAPRVARYLAEEQRILGDSRAHCAWQAVGSVVDDLLNGYTVTAKPSLH